MTKTYDASTQAMAAVQNMGKRGIKATYPWDELASGKCFTLPKLGKKLSTLRSLAYKYGKRHNKLFVVIEHEDLFEIARMDGIDQKAITDQWEQSKQSTAVSHWESTKPK